MQSQTTTQKATINRDSRGMLGIWSAADVIWGLCPRVRELTNHERPALVADIVKLFHELEPAERKVTMTSTSITRYSIFSLVSGNVQVRVVGDIRRIIFRANIGPGVTMAYRATLSK